MSLDDKAKNIVAEEENFQIIARYYRNKHGKCPAQRYNEKGEAYCSRLIPCEEYAAETFVRDREMGVCGRDYVGCRYVEKLSSRALQKKGSDKNGS